MKLSLGITPRDYSVAGGVTYDADALAYFTANTAITSAADKNAINTFYLGLKSDGIYTKMKAMYLPLWSSATANKWNLINPVDTNGAFRLNFSTGWTHTSSGTTPNGISAYADTFIIPSTSLTLNSTHLSTYIRTNAVTSGGIIFGAVNTVQPAALQCSVYSNNNGSIYDCYNSTTGQGRLLGSNVADSRGFALFTRSSSNSSKIFWKNSNIGSITTTGGGLPNAYNIVYGARTTDGTIGSYDSRQYSFSSVGTGLSDAEASSFYTRVQNLMTYFGLNY